MTIEIDKNIPVPSTQGRPSRYPWRGMEVGDSFWAESTANNVLVNGHNWCKRNGKQMEFRTQEEFKEGKKGVRLWRCK